MPSVPQNLENHVGLDHLSTSKHVLLFSIIKKSPPLKNGLLYTRKKKDLEPYLKPHTKDKFHMNCRSKYEIAS